MGVTIENLLQDDCCPWEWVCPRAGGGVTDDLGEVAGREEPGEVSPLDLLILFCLFHSQSPLCTGVELILGSKGLSAFLKFALPTFSPPLPSVVQL